jgi:hypothetical protein
MTMSRSTVRMFSFAVPLLIGGAPALMAQGRTLFTWTGRVDREVQITMRGRDLWTNGVDRDDASRSRFNVASPLPHTDGYVRVQAQDGRGDVSVVQQPSASNHYTTVVRIRDRSSGSDRYRVSAYWDSRYADNRGGYGRRDGDVPSRIDPRDRSNGGYGNGGGYENGGGYGNGSGAALRWSGNVDSELEIRLAGRRFDERTLSGGATRDERSSVIGEGLPRRDVQLVVSQRQGRGQVYVAQQPTAYNEYTAVIRVRDPQGGYGYYDFEVDYR